MKGRSQHLTNPQMPRFQIYAEMSWRRKEEVVTTRGITIAANKYTEYTLIPNSQPLIRFEV